MTTVRLHLVHLEGNYSNQNILPYALENCKLPAHIVIRQFEFIF